MDTLGSTTTAALLLTHTPQHTALVAPQLNDVRKYITHMYTDKYLPYLRFTFPGKLLFYTARAIKEIKPGVNTRSSVVAKQHYHVQI